MIIVKEENLTADNNEEIIEDKYSNMIIIKEENLTTDNNEK